MRQEEDNRSYEEVENDFFNACSSANLDEVHDFIKRDLGLNMTSFRGKTGLCLLAEGSERAFYSGAREAGQKNYADIMQLMLNAGANYGASDKYSDRDFTQDEKQLRTLAIESILLAQDLNSRKSPKVKFVRWELILQERLIESRNLKLLKTAKHFFHNTGYDVVVGRLARLCKKASVSPSFMKLDSKIMQSLILCKKKGQAIILAYLEMEEGKEYHSDLVLGLCVRAFHAGKGGSDEACLEVSVDRDDFDCGMKSLVRFLVLMPNLGDFKALCDGLNEMKSTLGARGYIFRETFNQCFDRELEGQARISFFKKAPHCSAKRDYIEKTVFPAFCGGEMQELPKGVESAAPAAAPE